LIANGTLPTSTSNPNIPSGGVISVTPNVFITTTATSNVSTTTPATPIQIDPIGNVITSVPIGVYVPVDDSYAVVDTPGAPPVPITVGLSNTPGSFAYSNYTNTVPPPLNTWYTSKNLYPSTYTVSQAIEEVIRCNCDCWQIA
jgi:hypothetical protein